MVFGAFALCNFGICAPGNMFVILFCAANIQASSSDTKSRMTMVRSTFHSPHVGLLCVVGSAFLHNIGMVENVCRGFPFPRQQYFGGLYS